MIRTFTLLSLTAALALPMQAQVVFESGFEDWANDLPTDWFGVRSNIAASGVAQVDADVFEGQFAVRLTKEGTGHQRFTTQPQNVVDGQGYEVTFQVRGEGQIRLGLYDGRPSGSGYATYTGWQTVTGNTWGEITLSITAAMTTSEAEFILSVQSTVAPEHLVVDDVVISAVTVEPPPAVTIQEIQESQAPDGASPLLGELVSTGGIVTAVASNGFFLQNGGGPWSGIFVFSTQNVPARGDSVTFTGSVTEFFGMTQLQNINDFEVVSQGNPEVVSTITAAQANIEDYEGVLVRVLAATCTNPDIGNNQWEVNDGTASLSVDNLLYTFAASQGATYNITGPTRISFDVYRVMPRDASDIEVVTRVNDLAVASIQIHPNPANDVIWLEGLTSMTEYQLSDLAGRTVASGSLVNDRNSIGTSSLSNGSYVLTLRNGDAVRSMRLLVQH